MKKNIPLSCGQAARLLGISNARVQQLRRAGDLAGQHTWLGWFYERDEVTRLARKRKTAADRRVRA